LVDKDREELQGEVVKEWTFHEPKERVTIIKMNHVMFNKERI
jgi:hypothetical protein